MALCAQRAARWSGAAAAAAAQQQQAQQAGCVRVRRLSHLDFLLSMAHGSLLSFLSLSPSITAPPPHTQTTKLSKIWFPPVIGHSTTQRRRHLRSGETRRWLFGPNNCSDGGRLLLLLADERSQTSKDLCACDESTKKPARPTARSLARPPT